MPVDVDYIIHDEVYTLYDLIGGIRVTVDGQRINTFADEQTMSFMYDWQPEFTGEYINTDFSSLVRDACRLAEGDVAIYESIANSFSASLSYWLFEPISPNELRIAFRIETSNNRSETPLILPECARGFVVDRCSFCEAVNAAAHEYLEEVRAMSADRGGELIDTFESDLSDLDMAIETCEETPPEI